MRRAPGRSAGFTLVELMVVIIIIGLVGGVAVSSWTSMMPNQEFNTAVRNLSEVLHETRSNAIARNRKFSIHYDLDADTYRVRTPFKAGGGFATSVDDAERIWIHATDLGVKGIDLTRVTVDDQVFTDGVVEIVFQPLGASSYHVIELEQTTLAREFTLEVLPLTGEIRMHDGFFERDPVDEGDFR